MSESPFPIKGRGTNLNPSNRFERLHVIQDFEQIEHDEEYLEKLQRPETRYIPDSTKSVLTRNDSPDVPFTYSINPYRGCSHGCVYCYARPTHEYLGMSAGLDFETKIMVKEDAPELLRKALMKDSWVPEHVAMSGVTDCYQPVERRLRITRGCLEVLREFGNPVTVITKNALVVRDADILGEMGRRNLARVAVSITSLDAGLSAVMEPRTSVPRARLEAVRRLTEAGVKVSVMVAPVVPGLTDHEMVGILRAAKEAGAVSAGYIVMRLPFVVKELFEGWLRAHFPDRAEKVLHRIESLRGGKLNDARFGSRLKGEGIWAEQIGAMFRMECGRLGLGMKGEGEGGLDVGQFRRPGTLFG